MQCPVDGADLLMSGRHGVEIDYCPTCRGVWLDRGELDKIIERVNGAPSRNDRVTEHQRSARDDRGRLPAGAPKKPALGTSHSEPTHIASA